ncbi:protein-S-isoprenylcysteine O-methyltransferase isoform X1 [Hypanus sabinus]|uniref:protein-S-isoprenylcysteine O-methyltransferase isoform X1 n=1 Tax=Hypanus sabinus TaxID=79690 RepID=UPI0028C49517|nr:protein-S-isoprenylcysteine O-methyltransferase isoform X1 [Hypanus sabinus]
MAGGRLVAEGRLSAGCFALGVSVVLVPALVRTQCAFTSGALLATYLAVINVLLLLLYRGLHYQIAVRACFLGFVCGCGLILSFGGSSWQHFGWYLCSLSFFHYSEYFVTAVINPKSLSLDSFLLNHSAEYKLAAMSSWVEFTIEKLLFPDMKQVTWLSFLGLLMALFGESLRKAAMLTAGSNFNHIVQNEKAESHRLVTSGVYSWSRHPSYVGWFYWSIGTQVILCNPICIVGYTLASWRFFRERIEEEEMTLIQFFGEDYELYKKQIPTRLPFIKGAKLEP